MKRQLLISTTVFSICFMALASTASGETVLIEIGKQGDAPAFQFSKPVQIGGSLELAFQHEGKRYKVLITAKERSAKERVSMGIASPKFEVALYRGGVSPDRLMAHMEANYPIADKKIACTVHVEPAMTEAFWITFGIGLGSEDPEDSCRRMIQITDKLEKK